MTKKRLTTDEESVDLGEEVTVRSERPSGPVVAVRIPREVLTQLSAGAQTRGITVSELIRQAAIRYVAEATPAPHLVGDAPLEGPNVVAGSGPRSGWNPPLRHLEIKVHRG